MSTADLTISQNLIQDVCKDICKFLIDKNKKYGDSAIHPLRCFSKASNVEQIKVRIDDKLNRLMQGSDAEDEDVRKDLIGYLILWEVAERSSNIK